jgi:hypothetical protein
MASFVAELPLTVVPPGTIRPRITVAVFRFVVALPLGVM